MSRSEGRGGKAAVLSGAGGGGIGTACALMLAKEGFRVFSIERTRRGQKAACDLVGLDSEDVLVGDIGNESTSRALAARFKRQSLVCSVVVHNAARGSPAKKIQDVTEREFMSDVRDILLGGFFLAKHLTPPMPKGSGRLVFITSSAAIRGARGRGPSYAASKAALHGLTKQLALDLSVNGTTVNSIVPFQTLTPRVLRGNRRTKESIERSSEINVPLARPAYPDDIAALLRYIVSEDAGYITGQVISLDGGQMLAPIGTATLPTTTEK